MRRLDGQKGFAAIEAVLVLVVVAILAGTGYYVYHANKKTDATLNAASKASQSSPAKTTKKKASAKQPADSTATQYFTIKEWGVRASETNGDTLTYKFVSGSDNSIEVISQKLSQYGCTDRGAGGIARLKGTDPASNIYPPAPADQTVAQYAAGISGYGHVGDYYYFFIHDQAACGNIGAGPPGSPSAGEQAQSAANDFTKQSIVPNLQPVP